MQNVKQAAKRIFDQWFRQALPRLLRFYADHLADSNLLRHAQQELMAIGYDPNDTKEGPNKWMQQNMKELLTLFSLQGHSGCSAGYTVDTFCELARFKPLCPLTGREDEWGEPFDNEGTRQNRRCGHVFLYADGSAYDTNGKIFREPNGGCFINQSSRVLVEFPYTPKSEYVDVPKSHEDN